VLLVDLSWHRQRGWVGLDGNLIAEALDAATVAGRWAAAAKARELGYGVVADRSPSARRADWAIAGIPDALVEHMARHCRGDIYDYFEWEGQCQPPR
jgi:hypothetical protein